MEKKRLTNIVIYLLTLVVTPIISADVQERFAPNEIIVKFRENTANIIEKQLDNSVGTLSSSPHLTQLNAKYQVRQISPLLRNFRTKHQQLQSIRQKKSRPFNPERSTHSQKATANTYERKYPKS